MSVTLQMNLKFYDNMKKILFLLFALSMIAFTSCSDDEDAQFVEFDKSVLEVGPESNGYLIDLKTNCQWSFLSVATNWIEIIPDNNTSIGDTYIRITVKENTSYAERSSVIKVASEDGSSTSEIKIVQKENKGILGDNSSGEFSGERQEITVNVKANVDIEKIQMPQWIESVPESKSLSSKFYKFILSDNRTGKERTGGIVFDGEGASWEYTVTQKPLQVLPAKIEFEEGSNVLLSNNSTFTLTPVFTPAECTEKELEWTSSNENVVTVSNGVINVVGNGEAKITAKSKIAGISASFDITVKIEAQQIMLMDGTAQMNTETNWTFGYKTKIRLGSIPENAYLGDVFLTSSDESVVSIIDGHLVANSKEGTSQIDIYDPYSLIHAIVNITVKRCITQGGFKLINQTSDALMMSFAGTIQNSIGVEVLGASLVNGNNQVLASTESISIPSDIVQFSTCMLNMTSLFGIYTIGGNDFPKLRFLVSYRLNSDSTIYQEYIDINPLTQVGW